MKRLQILRFIINLLLVCVAFEVTAQSRINTASSKPNTKQPDSLSIRHKYPFFNGVMVGVNLVDPIFRIFGQRFGGYEAIIEANLHNRFFPELSFGIGDAHAKTDKDIIYDTKPSFFGRIGMNYNFRYNSESPNFLIVGLRYGFSSYKADISNLYYSNGYWEQSGPYSLMNQKFNTHWIEIGAGIRVKVFKNLYMGWMVYFKPLLKEGDTKEARPWYIPGYGANDTSFGLTYNIYYRLPFKHRK